MAKPVSVQPARGRRDRNAFIRLPLRLYSHDPHWVAPLNMEMREKLDPRRHPFYRHSEATFFLARREGAVVGRIAALINNRHNDFHGEKMAGFGLLELEEDLEIARALIGAAAHWARERGMQVLRGPFNLSTNEECGTLIEGFDSPPAVMMPYNPPWHATQLAAAGLRRVKDLLAYHVDRQTDFGKIARLTERLLKREPIHVRPFDRRKLPAEVAIARSIYNEAWEKNWGFVPMTDDEFQWQARKLKAVLAPELALFAYVENEPAAFSLSLPDLNQALAPLRGRLLPFGVLTFLRRRREIDGIRVLTMGVRKRFRGLGLEGLLIHKTIEAGYNGDYHWAELSWILEDNNAIRRIVERVGARVYKRYTIWEAPVEEIQP